MENKRPYNAAKNNYKGMLEGKEWIQILSKDTGEIYIDENYIGYIFEKQENADKFIEARTQNEDGKTPLKLECSKKSVIDYNSFSWICVCIGVEKVMLNGTEEIHIKKRPNERGYTNPELTKNVNLLLETSKVEYLKELGKQHFIVPSYTQTITASSNGLTKTIMMYGTVNPDAKSKKKNKNYPLYYLAFTDMDHYTRWSEEHGMMFEPLEVEFWQLMQIVGKSGVCVNPEEIGTFLLTDENLSRVEYNEPASITEEPTEQSEKKK